MKAELTDAIAAWQKTREPRWAAVADWASGAALALADRPPVGAGKKKADRAAWDALEQHADPLDLPRLLQALGKMTAAEAGARVKVLARRDDPRLFSQLLEVLRAPPWRANVYKGFVTAVCESLERDPRVSPALSELSERYRGIIETSVGDWVGSRLAKAARELTAQAAPLSPAQTAKLLEAEAQFAQQLSAVKSSARDRQKGEQMEDELLAAIYAAPGDDGPRLVFADALSERGDPRGEFIALQVGHAAGQRSPESLARETQLLSNPKDRAAWALPLSKGGECRFTRGFPGRMTFRAATAGKVKGEAAFATLTALSGLEALSTTMACSFLEHPAIDGIADVGKLTAKVMEALEPRPRRWTTLHLADPLPAALAPHVAGVRTLRLESMRGPVPVQSLTGFHAVVDLGLLGSGFTPAHLAPFAKLEKLTVNASPEVEPGLQRLTLLQRLEVFWPLRPTSIQGLPLRELRLNYPVSAVSELTALVAAAPKLQHLYLGRTQESSLLTVLDALAGAPLQSVEVAFDNETYRLRGTALTVTRARFVSSPFVDVLTPALEAGRIVSARVGPDQWFNQDSMTMPSEERLAALDAVLGRFGVKLERDWLSAH